MDKNLLKSLIPLNALTHHSLELLAEETKIETLAAGSQLFAQGDVNDHTIYRAMG